MAEKRDPYIANQTKPLLYRVSVYETDEHNANHAATIGAGITLEEVILLYPWLNGLPQWALEQLDTLVLRNPGDDSIHLSIGRSENVE